MKKHQQIARKVPPGSRVLDVGCGPGDLGCSLAGKQCHVTGWDLELDRINANRKFYHSLEELDIEKQGFGNEKFDVMVFSDVLEHLIYPEKVLTKSSESLRPGGRVLISLPNVAFLDIRIGLLKGNWNYTNEGILARSHLKFYTLSTAGQLLMSSGFKVQDMEAEIPIIHSAWKSVVYSILSKAWPSLFATGWIFQGNNLKNPLDG